MEINIVEYDEIRAGIDKIKTECDFLPDVSTKEGYEKSKRLALDHGKILTKLEAVRKERKSYWLEGGKQVDSQAKAIKTEIEEAIGPHKDAYKNLDNAKKERERARVTALEERVQFIITLPESMQDSSSDEIMAAIEGLNGEECLDFYEFTMQALEARKASQQKLADLYQSVKKSEDEAKELAELRKLQEERAQQEREEQIRNEAIASQQKAVEEAEQKAKDAADNERRRIAAEAEQKRLEDEKRERDKKHVGAVRKAAKEAIMMHEVDEATAKALVLAIHKGDIPNVSIKY